MTERNPRPAKRKPPPRVQPRKVYIATACAFMAAAGGLSAQMATGNDPSLSAQKPAAVVPPTTVKRVIRTVVVTKVVKHRKPTASAAAPAAPASTGYTSQTPSYSAPASQPAAAPVQTYTPPPAPAAPAPAAAAPVTRTS